MSVPKNFKICHKNEKKDFVDMTYSGFKKTDVMRELTNSIKKGIVKNTNNWVIEIILSGYTDQYMKKMLIYMSKNINIGNPYLPIFFWNIYDQYNIITTTSDCFEIRNNIEIRNNLSTLNAIITLSEKKPLAPLPKISPEKMGIIHDKSQLYAKDLDLIRRYIKPCDKTEVVIVVNEIATILNTNNRSYNHQERCMFWLAWIQYYSKNTSAEICGERITKGVHQSLARNPVFFIWQIILDEVSNRTNEKLINTIKSLFQLFKIGITKSNITSKYCHIQHAILLLLNTLPGINYGSSFYPNKEIAIKYALKNNFYYNKIINDTTRTYYAVIKKDTPVKIPVKDESIVISKHKDTYDKFRNKAPPDKDNIVLPEAKPLAPKNKLILSEINSLLTNDYEEANKIGEEYANYKPK